MKRIKVIVPIPMDDACVSARAEQLPADFVRAGFQPEFVAVPWGAALGDSNHDMMLMDWTVFQAGITAEEEGYAGMLIDTVSDSGLRSIETRPDVTELLSGKEEVIFDKLREEAILTIEEDGKFQEVYVYMSGANVLV